ncbi:hypothetical protein [uncultured Shewanella sp.]|uniref:alpha/beta hydrolase n=1 Tax=uncultured Shewanella sp. TaxID=173975 RepID=UPI00262FDD23|nr:hypothetical protein [uncultured Shewanella sp.]
MESLKTYADEFIQQISDEGKTIGTAQGHMVGHSAGGLIGRMLLKKLSEKDHTVQVSTMDGSPVYENMDLKSLLTHASPHKGTLVADYFPYLFPSTNFSSDICDLKVSTWKVSNQRVTNLNGAKLASIGADADMDQSGDLNASEIAGNQIEWSYLANTLHKLLYDYDELKITYDIEPGQGGGIVTHKVHYFGTGPNPNDSMVTLESSHGAPGITSSVSMTGVNGKNHGTVIDTHSQNEGISQGTTVLGWGDLK